MERKKLLGLAPEIHMNWHARRTLQAEQPQPKFYTLHSNPQAKEILRAEAEILTVFDIQINFPHTDREKLQIKHLTQER